MATDRSALRTSLQYKTGNQLTSSTDQDYYLNKAEIFVQNDWTQFDPSIQTTTRGNATTDTNGQLQLPANITQLELLEDVNKVKYSPISIQDRWVKTGYYFQGMDTSNTYRIIVVMNAGTPLVSTTLYYIVEQLNPMGAATNATSIIPEEFREMIAIRAAELWYRDQGPPMFQIADGWLSHYNNEWLVKAKRAYKTLDNEPIFAKSYDADAGGKPFTVHVITQ